MGGVAQQPGPALPTAAGLAKSSQSAFPTGPGAPGSLKCPRAHPEGLSKHALLCCVTLVRPLPLSELCLSREQLT